MKTFLVTGAAGFIGSHCVDRLLGEGYRVVGVDNFRSGKRENLVGAMAQVNFELLEGDAADESFMSEVFVSRQLDGVLHLAALVSVPESFHEPKLNYKSNLQATDIVARLCIKHQCKRIVFASSAAVYGDRASLPNRETNPPDPKSPYAATKLASEVMLLGYAASFGLDTVCFRYFNIYGPRQDPGSPYSGVLSIFTERFSSGQPITVFGDGEQTRDFVSVKDVATANCDALTSESVSSGRYNVCTGESVSLNQVLALYAEHYQNAPAPLYAESREGDIRHSCGDPSSARESIDFVARVAFSRGVSALLRGELPS